MSKKGPTIKKELTLIERIVENSKDIIEFRSIIKLLSEAQFLAAKCKFHPLSYEDIKHALTGYRLAVTAKARESANMLKAAYAGLYNIDIGDLYYLNSAQLQSGIDIFTRKSDKKQMVLFFVDCDPENLLDPIKAGEIVELTDDIRKYYLPKCKTAWKPPSRLDFYLAQEQKDLLT